MKIFCSRYKIGTISFQSGLQQRIGDLHAAGPRDVADQIARVITSQAEKTLRRIPCVLHNGSADLFDRFGAVRAA